MRGKQRMLNLMQLAIRITPACAGKTPMLRDGLRGLRDHPRVCGENQPAAKSEASAAGSPPRVRGKLVGCSPSRSVSGITPACAGKTGREQRGSVSHGDHPRVCGENALDARACPQCVGSPPRVRGKPALRISTIKDFRITPACAGKTSSSTAPSLSQQDHPRVCGENKIDVTIAYRDQGSPPRVRGKHVERLHKLASDRITPACAGKTNRNFGSRIAVKDHPRVCGENKKDARLMTCSEGSPPRVRGKPFKRGERTMNNRITPACAGKTPTSRTETINYGDHPRVCGENDI